MERLERGDLHRVDLLGDLHRADLGGEPGAEPAREHEARDDGADLFEHAEREHARQERLGAEARERAPALHREHDADGEPAHADEQEALAPHLVHLIEQLLELERPPPEPLEELGDEAEQAAGLVEEAVEHALRVPDAVDRALGEALLAEDLLVRARLTGLPRPLGERGVRGRRGLWIGDAGGLHAGGAARKANGTPGGGLLR